LSAITFALFWSAVFVLGELALRIYHGELLSFSLLDVREDPLGASHPAYDEILGYQPEPGERTHPDQWVATIDADRLRIPGKRSRPDGVPWLAAGDSFAFGDEVADDETWPAELERISGRRVLNAGVYGYGLDQAVLRAERMLAIFKPERLILSVITGDIDRCQNSFLFGRWKPYFDVVDDELTLFNTPVPTVPREISTLRRLTGWSFMFRGLFRRIAPDWWFLGRDLKVHERGDDVARRLMDRISRSAKSNGASLLVVALVDRDMNAVRLPALIEYLRRTGVPVLDLVETIEQRADREGVDAVFMPKRHLRPELNRWVAREIALSLGSQELVQGHASLRR
jgi:hypothetical protein